jgi:hypothetical protein
LEGGADVCFAGVGVSVYDSESYQIGVFFVEVVDLNLLGYEVIVVFVLYLLTIQVNQPRDNDDLLFHGYSELALIELPLG